MRRVTLRYKPQRHAKRHERVVVKDEFAIVLDYMPLGNPYDKHPQHRTSPVAQAIGTKYFTLVEIIPLKELSISVGERIPIASMPNLPGHPVYDRLTYNDLTTVAKENLEKVLRRIVEEKERVFVQFFNIAEPINIRLHSLELLPGIGKKTLALILEERKKKPFESFEDIRRRVRINDPAKLFVDRLLTELRCEERYYLFIDPYPPSTEYRRLGYLELLYKYTNYSDPW